MNGKEKYDMGFWRKTGNGITTLNRKVFEGAAWLNYPLIFVVMFEVVRRYVFLNPTNWVYDMTWIIFGACTFLGGAFVLAEGGHVKADIILDLLPPKGRAILNLISYLLFYFPLMILLTYSSYNYFWKSLISNETSAQTSWRPILWPSKLIMLIAFALLLLQGIVEFVKAIKPLFEKSGGENK